MTDRPALVWKNTPEFFEELFSEIQKHGCATASVSPEEMAASRRALEAHEKSAAKRRRTKTLADRS